MTDLTEIAKGDAAGAVIEKVATKTGQTASVIKGIANVLNVKSAKFESVTLVMLKLKSRMNLLMVISIFISFY